jgi:hypothetical protein
MGSPENLLQLAVEHYGEMLALYAEIAEVLQQGEEGKLGACAAHLATLQTQIERTERELFQNHGQVGPEVESHPLFQERRYLLEQLSIRNRSLLSEAGAKLSVVAAELGHIRGGRTAMAGYRGVEQGRGRILSRSF